MKYLIQNKEEFKCPYCLESLSRHRKIQRTSHKYNLSKINGFMAREQGLMGQILCVFEMCNMELVGVNLTGTMQRHSDVIVTSSHVKTSSFSAGDSLMKQGNDTKPFQRKICH